MVESFWDGGLAKHCDLISSWLRAGEECDGKYIS